MKTIDVLPATPTAGDDAMPPAEALGDTWEAIFRADLAFDIAVERRLFFREVWIVVVVVVLVLLREML
jgi:hypothetical protein